MTRRIDATGISRALLILSFASVLFGAGYITGEADDWSEDRSSEFPPSPDESIADLALSIPDGLFSSVDLPLPMSSSERVARLEVFFAERLRMLYQATTSGLDRDVFAQFCAQAVGLDPQESFEIVLDRLDSETADLLFGANGDAVRKTMNDLELRAHARVAWHRTMRNAEREGESFFREPVI